MCQTPANNCARRVFTINHLIHLFSLSSNDWWNIFVTQNAERKENICIQRYPMIANKRVHCIFISFYWLFARFINWRGRTMRSWQLSRQHCRSQFAFSFASTSKQLNREQIEWGESILLKHNILLRARAIHISMAIHFFYFWR